MRTSVEIHDLYILIKWRKSYIHPHIYIYGICFGFFCIVIFVWIYYKGLQELLISSSCCCDDRIKECLTNVYLKVNKSSGQLGLRLLNVISTYMHANWTVGSHVTYQNPIIASYKIGQLFLLCLPSLEMKAVRLDLEPDFALHRNDLFINGLTTKTRAQRWWGCLSRPSLLRILRSLRRIMWTSKVN